MIPIRPTPSLSPCPKTNPWSRARQEAEVKPRFLTGAVPNHTVPNRGLVSGQVLNMKSLAGTRVFWSGTVSNGAI